MSDAPNPHKPNLVLKFKIRKNGKVRGGEFQIEFYKYHEIVAINGYVKMKIMGLFSKKIKIEEGFDAIEENFLSESYDIGSHIYFDPVDIYVRHRKNTRVRVNLAFPNGGGSAVIDTSDHYIKPKEVTFFYELAGKRIFIEAECVDV